MFIRAATSDAARLFFNAMSLYDERIADLQEIEGDLPNTFQFGTGAGQVSGPCIPTLSRAGEQLVVGGKLATIRRTLFIRCALMPTAPAAMQPIKFKENSAADFTEYRIADVNQTSDLANYEIALATLDKV